MITSVPRAMVTRAWVTAPPPNIRPAAPARPTKPAVIAESCTSRSGCVRSDTATRTPSEATTAARRTPGTRSAKSVMSRSGSCGSGAGSRASPSVILSRLLRAAVHPGRRPRPAGAALEACQLVPRDLRRFGRRGLLGLLVSRCTANLAGLRDAQRQPRDGWAACPRGPGHGMTVAVTPGCRWPGGPSRRRLAVLLLAEPGHVPAEGIEVAGSDGLEDGRPVARLRTHRLGLGHAGRGSWGR